MENYNPVNVKALSEEDLSKAQVDFVSKAFAWMASGLLTTGLVSWYVFSSGLILQLTSYILFLAIASIGLVWFLSARIESLSKNTAIIIFFVYAALLGVTLSTVFLTYTLTSISNVFFITTGMFGAMAFYGFVTKKDLSGMGRFMFMGLIGIILAMVMNFFIASSVLDLTISIIGVVIFSGLAAYDTQKIKDMFYLQFQGDEIATKGAIMGGLALYLDFINLFLFLLRILGSRD